MGAPEELRRSNLHRSLTNVTPSADGIWVIEALRGAGKALGDLIIDTTKGSREQSLALTHLEETIMWAVKGVVLNGVPAHMIVSESEGEG